MLVLTGGLAGGMGRSRMGEKRKLLSYFAGEIPPWNLQKQTQAFYDVHPGFLGCPKLWWCRRWGGTQLLSAASVFSDRCGNTKQKTMPKLSLSVGTDGADLVHQWVPFLRCLSAFWWAWESGFLSMATSLYKHLCPRGAPRHLGQSTSHQPASYVSFN